MLNKTKHFIYLVCTFYVLTPLTYPQSIKDFDAGKIELLSITDNYTPQDVDEAKVNSFIATSINGNKEINQQHSIVKISFSIRYGDNEVGEYFLSSLLVVPRRIREHVSHEVKGLYDFKSDTINAVIFQVLPKNYEGRANSAFIYNSKYRLDNRDLQLSKQILIPENNGKRQLIHYKWEVPIGEEKKVDTFQIILRDYFSRFDEAQNVGYYTAHDGDDMIKGRQRKGDSLVLEVDKLGGDLRFGSLEDLSKCDLYIKDLQKPDLQIVDAKGDYVHVDTIPFQLNIQLPGDMKTTAFAIYVDNEALVPLIFKELWKKEEITEGGLQTKIHLPAGTYFLKISDEHQTKFIHTQTIEVQKIGESVQEINVSLE